MEELQILIEQMVSNISNQAISVEEIRLQKFLEWLNAHSSQMKTGYQARIEVPGRGAGRLDERLTNSLKGWFESLPLPGLLWEYHLLLREITWWRDLDPRSLARILRSEKRK